MSKVRPPWQEGLAIIDRTMKAISGVTDPEELVGIYWDGINQLTRSYTRAGTFVTAFYAVLDPSSGTLTYSRAGHNLPRLVRDGQVHALDECGALPLGILLAQTYDQSTIRLDDGDLLLLYTDGITETMSPRTGADEDEIFGIEGWIACCWMAPPAALRNGSRGFERRWLRFPATRRRSTIRP